MYKESSRLWKLAEMLRANPKRWLLTGAAGFIGSHLLEFLLFAEQEVIAIDNFTTGRLENLIDVQKAIDISAWRFCSFNEIDICNFDILLPLLKDVDVVLHQAAFGSVPRSIDNPLATNRVNCDGFLSVAHAASISGVKRFIFASSSSVYGSDQGIPKVEECLGQPLSPYAASKVSNESYAQALSILHPTSFIGLRYFNVFGPRQDPNGQYAAVIPRWIQKLISGEECHIYGDGTTSRDFCYVLNVVQANILAACAPKLSNKYSVYNVASGEATSLDRLYTTIATGVSEHTMSSSYLDEPVYDPFRKGDVKHSLADIRRIQSELGYVPEWTLSQGLEETLAWFDNTRDKVEVSEWAARE